ncbi:MAG: hypothetical protein K0S33_1114 [Bacteroidetes bacterium]|nr:hypothetical protein [Bacteroidota bacterium]
MFDLELGFDYKITFSSPGCADMYCMVYGAKCPADKAIFPIYDIDVTFFEYGQARVNYLNFKNPFTKIIFDGKKTFKDDDKYVEQFLKDLYIDFDEIKKLEEEKLEKEKHEKELMVKQKLEQEEKLRQEQIALADKKAKEEAEILRRKLEEQHRLEKEKEAKSMVNVKENEANESMVKEEINLTIKKEQQKIKEKQNKAIKTNYENDLLKLVAENEKQLKEKTFTKERKEAEKNEVIEILRQEAITKAKASEVRFDKKIKAKQAVLNSRILNHEMTGLVKTVAQNSVSAKIAGTKTYPVAKNYRSKTMVGITTDSENGTFKNSYNISISEGDTKTIYRKEKYSWGLIYYFKNDTEINEEQYYNELSVYNVPL